MIRFEHFGSKEPDLSKLRHVQNWLAEPHIIHGCSQLNGVDALVWGTISTPGDYMKDLIQVVHDRETSPFLRFTKTSLLSVTGRWPRVLRNLIFWSSKEPDEILQI